MPNWCHNRLTVSGPPRAVRAFVKKVSVTEGDQKTPLTFVAHVPIDPDGTRLESPIESWGTKWDARPEPPRVVIASTPDAQLPNEPSSWIVTEEGASIAFSTAWSPPTEWFFAVVMMEPKLDFVLRYAEPGIGFAGEVVSSGGMLTEKNLAVPDVLSSEEMWY